jgi:energy-converting hydrogenase B subunit D
MTLPPDFAGGWMVSLLDLAVAVLLVALAARLLHTRNLFEAIVLFIAYGLTLSLAWVQVGAPNIALAEAALGAGVTGALFLNTFQRLAERSREGSGMVDPEHGDRGPEAGP